MTYIQIRITHGEFDCDRDKLEHLVKIIINYCNSTEWIYCIETKDKFGNDTKRHLHLNLFTEEIIKKDTLQKKIRKIFMDRSIELKGNKMYSVRILNDPENESRWWRYVCKEQGCPLCFSPNFEHKIEEYKMLARDERKESIKRNNKTINSYLDKSSFKGKMYENFTQNGVKTHKKFIIELIKYYQEKAKVPPFSKLEDYWIDFRIQTGIITPEQYYNIKYN